MGATSRQKRVRVFEDPKAYQRYRRAKFLWGAFKIAVHVVFWVAIVAVIWLILTVVGSPPRMK